MGKDSEISWTHHTFNPWRGCTKVSPGCTHCYAETLSHRNPAVLGIWGDKGTRVVASEAMWREPLKWDAAARSAGERHRVFCASLADVFEDRPELKAPRSRLMGLIAATPRLDWLLLTKRPENMARFFASRPAMFRAAEAYRDLIYGPDSGFGVGDGLAAWPPRNVWAGTSVENQAAADERIPHLLRVPAAVRFLSCEPLLGPVEFSDVGRRDDFVKVLGRPALEGIDWVIVGGESGPGARPMHPDWARSIRDQCVAAGVAFHFKQWGEYIDADQTLASGNRIGFVRHHQWPDGKISAWFGKGRAGRLLDGRTWDEFPKTEAVSHA